MIQKNKNSTPEPFVFIHFNDINLFRFSICFVFFTYSFNMFDAKTRVQYQNTFVPRLFQNFMFLNLIFVRHRASAMTLNMTNITFYINYLLNGGIFLLVMVWV